MSDILNVIKPKSDQLNYDDLSGGRTLTIKVTNVTIGSGDQPVAIHFENDNGKPYKPCKSMCRVMVNCWGPDVKKYIGRSMTLYGDPKVIFGGMAVGGIRISHMSDIDKEMTMALTATRASRKPFTVQKLSIDSGLDQKIIDLGKEEAKKGKEAFIAWYNMPDQKKIRAKLQTHMSEFQTIIDGVAQEQAPPYVPGEDRDEDTV